MKKIRIQLLIAITLIVGCSMISSSHNKKEDTTQMAPTYHILTNYGLYHENEKIEILAVEKKQNAITLKLTYRSDRPFVIEIGMLDNFVQRSFRMKDEGQFREDTVFTLNMPQTNGEMMESATEIRLPILSKEQHDIVFFIHNRTKTEGQSLRGYDFLRLFIDAENGNESDLLKPKNKVEFAPETLPENMMELNPVFDNKHSFQCNLQYNIENIYRGPHFRPSYENNLEQPFPFVIVAIQENHLVRMKKDFFVWSETLVGQNGTVALAFHEDLRHDIPVTFISIPYPYRNPEELEHYQLVAYQNQSYYQYDFSYLVDMS